MYSEWDNKMNGLFHVSGEFWLQYALIENNNSVHLMYPGTLKKKGDTSLACCLKLCHCQMQTVFQNYLTDRLSSKFLKVNNITRLPKYRIAVKISLHSGSRNEIVVVVRLSPTMLPTNVRPTKTSLGLLQRVRRDDPFYQYFYRQMAMRNN